MCQNGGDFVSLSQQFCPRLSVIAKPKEIALVLWFFKPGQQFLDSSVSVTRDIIL